VKVQRVKLDTGISIEYSLTGVENDQTILFLHGLGPNLRQFEPQEVFFHKSYQVLLVSLRGHGGSSGPPNPTRSDYTLEQYARDMQTLLSQLKIPRVHFIGNSAGGLVGAELLDMDESLLTSLTTFGTTAELHTPPFVAWMLITMTRFLGPAGIGRLSSLSTRDKRVAKEVGQMFAATSKEALYLTQRNIADYDYTDVLRCHDTPILLIKGELDKEINSRLESTLAVLQQKPNFRLVELKGAGHFSNMEKPEEFNRVLSDFLEDLGK
jgi:3-oxoadipate enol-lactonase